MKNLHKINNLYLPDWVKQMILAWAKQRGTLRKVTYIRKNDTLSISGLNPVGKERWEARGWSMLMRSQNLEEFPPRRIRP